MRGLFGWVWETATTMQTVGRRQSLLTSGTHSFKNSLIDPFISPLIQAQ